MSSSARSFIFLFLAFIGIVFGMGQLWALAMAMRDGTSPNVAAAAVGALVVVPSAMILIRIMRVFVKKSSDNNIGRS